jgi:hypothetical protein
VRTRGRRACGLRGEQLMRRGIFVAYLSVILAGLAYFIVVGLLRL